MPMSARTLSLRFDDLEVESFELGAASPLAYYDGDTTDPCKIYILSVKYGCAPSGGTCLGFPCA